MDKRTIVRIELILLACLATLVIFRVFRGLPALDGEVTLSEIGRGDLEHQAFRIEEPTRVNITALGSLESKDANRSADAVMAAYPWIVRRSDRSLVWRMDPSHSEIEDGTLLRTEESVQLQPGDYDLYFASFGSSRGSSSSHRFFGVRLTDHWTADRKHWQVALKAENGELESLKGTLDSYGPEAMPNVIWTSGTMRDDRTAEQVLSVDEEARVSIYSVGEICDDSDCGDRGTVESLSQDRVIWTMTRDNSRPAGGSKSNFVFDGSIELKPGLYRVSYSTDGGHAYGRWFGNPPYDPAAWGLTLYAADRRTADRVHPFDVWEERTPIIELAPAGNDARLEQAFEVNETVDVLLYAMGEVHGDQEYDYGWLENLDTGELVWKMSAGKVQHAGGSSDNSIGEGVVRLEPGKYVLHYQSDDSHAWDSWLRRAPEHPERWGITMFPVLKDVGHSVTVLAETVPMASREETHDVSGPEIFSMVPAGNEQSYSASVEFDEAVRLHIRAIGEVSQFGAYDYGWIRNDADGEEIWRMTRSNTLPAGGDERYRLFDDIIKLEPGRYTIHFETDESHAYGDFREAAPDFQQDYGMRVVRLTN